MARDLYSVVVVSRETPSIRLPKSREWDVVNLQLGAVSIVDGSWWSSFAVLRHSWLVIRRICHRVPRCCSSLPRSLS